MKKGFTLIELLISISIIALLAAVILTSFGDAKNKGSNSAVKQNLSNVRAQMDISYTSNNNSYTNLCTTDTRLISILQAASRAGVGNTTSYVCNSTASAWAAYSPLRTQEGAYVYWCVDSLSRSIGLSSNPGAITSCQ